MALEVTDGNITEILKSNEITVIDFWAPWCGPCKMLGPIIEDIATSNSDVSVGKLNVDDNGQTAVKYGVRGIPTIIFFKNGEQVDKNVGLLTKAQLQERINALKS